MEQINLKSSLMSQVSSKHKVLTLPLIAVLFFFHTHAHSQEDSVRMFTVVVHFFFFFFFFFFFVAATDSCKEG